MPFKSDAQRRWMFANKPEMAREWADKYATGGSTMGLLDKMDEDVTITRKMSNGASVTYKSPEGSQMDMNGILGGMVEGYTPTPVSDNKMIAVTPGEYVVNFPAAQKYKGMLEMINDEGKQMLAMGGWTEGYAEGGSTWDRQAFIRRLLEDVKPGSKDEEMLLKRLGIDPMTRKAMGGMVEGYQVGGMVSEDIINTALSQSGQSRYHYNLYGPSATTQAVIEQLTTDPNQYGWNVAEGRPYTAEEGMAAGTVAADVPAPAAMAGDPTLDESVTPAPVAPVAPVAAPVVPEVPVAAAAPVSESPVGVEDASVAGPIAPEQLDEMVKADTDGSMTKMTLEGKVDSETANKAAEVVAKSDGVPSALENLLQEAEMNIRTLEDKRRSVKLMALGIALLGGKGSSVAAQIANQMAGQDDARIEALYDTRNTIIERAREKVLKAHGLGAAPSGEGFGTGWEGSDGKVYFSPEQVPDGVEITGKAGTVDPNVPTKWVSLQTEDAKSIGDIDKRRAQITNILGNVPENADFWSGLLGATSARVADILGSQDALDVWRTNVAALRNEIAIGDLPPGVASDKDIALVLKGTPSEFANPEALAQYLRGVEKLANYQKRYKEARIDYIEENKTASGFKAPAYEPDGADQAQIGVTGSATSATTTDETYDFDFSQ